MDEAEREVNEEWGREWRSANFAYGSSVYLSALAYLSDVNLREKEEWGEIEGETYSFCSATMQVVR
jgi:hypothetical protein